MEQIGGPTLAELARAQSGSGVDPERVTRELLSALDYIHAAGGIHRDFEPANVLFDGSGRVRLTDFGIALPHHATALTGTGEVIGTVRDMAPEVQLGGPASHVRTSTRRAWCWALAPPTRMRG